MWPVSAVAFAAPSLFHSLVRNPMCICCVHTESWMQRANQRRSFSSRRHPNTEQGTASWQHSKLYQLEGFLFSFCYFFLVFWARTKRKKNVPFVKKYTFICTVMFYKSAWKETYSATLHMQVHGQKDSECYQSNTESKRERGGAGERERAHLVGLHNFTCCELRTECIVCSCPVWLFWFFVSFFAVAVVLNVFVVVDVPCVCRFVS